MKYILIITFLILFQSSTVLAEDNAWEWQIAQDELTKEAYKEFSKMLDECRSTAMSNCVAVARADAGIKGNCKYYIENGKSKEQHLKEQFECFNAVGYTKEERKRVGARCRALADETCDSKSP